ncbi:MAG: hypothetical protein AMXMBFR64_54770 [Myxococcales bacterium]
MRHTTRTSHLILEPLLFALLLTACSSNKGGGGFVGGPGGGVPDVVGSTDVLDPSWGNKKDVQGPAPDSASDAATEGDAGGSGPLVPCTTDGDCPAQKPWCAPAMLCFECIEDSHCGDDQLCKNGSCKLLVCEPGDKVCNGKAIQTCNDDGTDFELFDCSPGTCEGGQCAGCTPGATVCQANDVMRCADDGSTFELLEKCTDGAQCINGSCLVCYPGQRKCQGKESYECSHDGKGWVFQQTCDESQVCLGGQCQSLCAADLKFNTNVGCDYFAVDLDNASGEGATPGADNAQFAVVVSNPGSSVAKVKIRKSKADAPQVEADVASGGLHIFNLPPHNVDGTMKGPRSWRIESTAPIIAYQFNPLENVGVYSNDASVLLPSNTWGTEYLVMSRWQTANNYRGYLTIVAGFEDTEVTVKVTAPTLAGGEVPALQKGDTWTTTLQPYEVLSIQAGANCATATPQQACGDLTGSEVTSTKPVGVFGGHEAAVTGTQCCADHLEQQMLPVSAWGKTYVASRAMPRGNEPDYWRILASKDGTKVITNPPQGPTPTLNRGQWVELSSKQHFTIDATEPIMVGQFLASSFEIGSSLFPAFCSGSGQSTCPNGHTCVSGSCEPIGDPAFILAAPVQQFRKEYTFLAPPKYLQDFANVIAPTGVDVLLNDSSILSKLKPVGNSGWSVAQLPIPDGVHTIRSVDESGIGIIVYGYDDDVSYGYTGGMSLEKINQ